MFSETSWSLPLGFMVHFLRVDILWQLVEILQWFLAIAFINLKLCSNGVIKNKTLQELKILKSEEEWQFLQFANIVLDQNLHMLFPNGKIVKHFVGKQGQCLLSATAGLYEIALSVVAGHTKHAIKNE